MKTLKTAVLATYRSSNWLLTACFLLLLTPTFAALSPQASVSVITVSPGRDLYDSFGHTALWVYDPAQGIDRVYGYGTYNFNAPNFYGKFVRGQLDYMISVIDMGTFLASYQYDNRSVVDQVLNLSPAQKEEIYAFLEKNYLPENRYYKYDFFFDNCTTRIRDVVKNVAGEGIQFSPPAEKRSFRQWIDLYLQEQYWSDFGMDLGLGALSDRVATPYESMFLPETLMQGLEKATFISEGKRQRLVSQTRTLFQASPVLKEAAGFTPIRAFWLLFVIIALVTWWQYRKGKEGYQLNVFLFLLAGLIGCVLVFLWFGTDHVVTPNNWNLVWAWPLHLFIAFVLGRKSKPAWLQTYFLVYSLAVGILLVGWKFWPQELDAELIPLVLIFGIRALFIYVRLKSPKSVATPVVR
ncbi:MAG: DUF4105 domain-containing protein [Bacteroidota bacterium]